MHLDEQGLMTLPDVLTISEQYFSNPLTYTLSSQPGTRPIPLGQTNKLRALLWFNQANLRYNGGATVDYENTTHEMYQHFAATHFASFVTSNTPSGRTPPRPVNQELLNFKRCCGRWRTAYPILKTDNLWVVWHHQVGTQSMLHSTHLVLDPTYSPPANDPDLIELLAYQTAFMFDVFELVCQTTAAKEIINDNRETRDGRAVWVALCTRYTSSEMSNISVAELEHQINAAKVPSDYNGSYEDLLDQFVGLIRTYETIADPSLHFSDHRKCILLHNFLREIPEFSIARSTFSMVQSRMNSNFTYTEYIQVYRNLCIPADHARKTKKQGSSARSVNFTFLPALQDYYDETFGPEDDDDEDDGPVYVYATSTSKSKSKAAPKKKKIVVVDNPSSAVVPYKPAAAATPSPAVTTAKPTPATTTSKAGKRQVGVTKAIWNSLTPYEREGWDRLTDKHKTLIIQLGMSLANNAPIGNRSVHITEVQEDDDVEFVSDPTQVYQSVTNDSSPGNLSQLLGRLDTSDMAE
jgi:hypothetical protein